MTLSLTLVINYETSHKFICGVVDTCDKFTNGVVDTGHKFITGVIDTGDKSQKGFLSALFTPVIKLQKQLELASPFKTIKGLNPFIMH